MEKIEKGKKVMVVSAILTLFVAILKGIIGYISGSVALIADALHSLSDVLGPIAVYVGLKISQKKPNMKFPYGYSRAETLASLFVSFIIFLTGVETLRQSIDKFFNPSPISHYGAVIIVVLISIGITYYLYKYKTKVGVEIGSDAMIGEGAHSLVDAYTTVAILFAVAGSYMGYYIVEPIVGGIISFIVIGLGLKMVKNDIYTLMDFCDGETINEIKKITLSVKGVEGAHNIKARKSGPFIHCDMHIEVDEELPFKVAHEISETVEKEIKNNIQNINGIIIHTDPIMKKDAIIAIPIMVNDNEVNLMETNNGINKTTITNSHMEKAFNYKINDKFATAKYFLIIEMDCDIINGYRIIENTLNKLNRKKAMAIFDLLYSYDVNTVIVKNIGAGMDNTLRSRGIKIIKTDKDTPKDALLDIKKIK
ncbi:cation diffusion facilitator family transporter [Methanococcus aeolicus Nankai-3]|uniref:Cation diffusion facilitator family transporter n=1 Tax=Methanococcus aeolicus (strain ATCC BAA-1280 / DSM 17508 / OCM 812 / Nankai-3) TaxID=419665 RepID=A6UWS0_META3|nr:cation diffusion facilitator family transporter [Methanococcus aeolicus]ABR56942.1 cation diffusion facilitator family transporter [Methanococcus aeolicus Nankai-3]